MTDTATRNLRRLLLLVALVATAATAVAPAQAASSNCGRKVIDDWYDNGRVDAIYPLTCYTRAIKQLPEDLIVYATAKEDILRALQFAKQQKPDPGDTTGLPPTTETETTETETNETPPATATDTTDSTATETEQTGTETGADTFTDAAPADSGSSASSLPIPVLVLGGLALLLLAAGTAGFVTRRWKGRGDGGEPPTSAA